ncbi:GNAT family N-acetyltransferase [Pseudomonas sp. DB1]|uniref:GNAT family N-acetyltransferase n=1 Tax=Metapseudomonas boanensis TaxID=2822138 RepID=A0ABS5XCT9_9GAMM|nr:GNAT family N-acetyltransferase [Pseudomonas boanensis]
MTQNPLQFQHRPASAQDLDEVVRFPQDADELFFAYPKASWPLTVGQLAAAMAERRGSTVALLDGRVAGFANFYQWQHGDYCALGNVMVAPWARRQGVAQYLIEAMERLAIEQYKARLMKVSCFNANAGGLLLYSRLGYQPSGIVERLGPDGRRVALVQLDKSLEPAQ